MPVYVELTDFPTLFLRLGFKMMIDRYMSWYKDHKTSRERPTDSAMYKLRKQGNEVTKRKRKRRSGQKHNFSCMFFRNCPNGPLTRQGAKVGPVLWALSHILPLTNGQYKMVRCN